MARPDIKDPTDVSKEKKFELFLYFLGDPYYTDLSKRIDEHKAETIRDTLVDYVDWFQKYHPESEEAKAVFLNTDVMTAAVDVVSSKNYSDTLVLDTELKAYKSALEVL